MLRPTLICILIVSINLLLHKPAPGELKIDANTKGMESLGCGTDIFGEYAVESNIKGRVLDLDALNADHMLVLNPLVEERYYQTIVGNTISEYASRLSASVGIYGSYKFFSASIKTSFTGETYRKTEFSYATIMETNWKHSLKVQTDRWHAEYLKNYLTPEAKKAINNSDELRKWTAGDLIASYGTHVMAGIYVGARLDYHLAVNIEDQKYTKELDSYASAKFKGIFASAGIETDISNNVETKMNRYEKRQNIKSKGGDSQYANPTDEDDYDQWHKSINTNPVFCGIIKNALIPIWEFADTAGRKDEIMEYYKKYAEDKESDFEPISPARKIVTAIVITENMPTTLPGYELLKDYNYNKKPEKAYVVDYGYVNRGVSSKRTPRRQHDRIMEATKIWISYKAVMEDETTEAPINGIYIFPGNSEPEKLYGPHEKLNVDMNTDTCKEPVFWHTNPCPKWIPKCAYWCDNVKCKKENDNHLYLHYTKRSETHADAPIRCLVLGNEVALDKSKPFEDRKKAIWWGPQDMNDDGIVDDLDAQHVLNKVVWASDPYGLPINLNLGAKNYYVYDYECPWGCCWVKTKIFPSPAQYIGYVPYPD